MLVSGRAFKIIDKVLVAGNQNTKGKQKKANPPSVTTADVMKHLESELISNADRFETRLEGVFDTATKKVLDQAVRELGLHWYVTHVLRDNGKQPHVLPSVGMHIPVTILVQFRPSSCLSVLGEHILVWSDCNTLSEPKP